MNYEKIEEINNIENKSIENNNNEKEAKGKKNHNFLYAIIASLLTFILCFAVFFSFYEFYLKNLVETKIEKEVTVTDTGISDAVSNVMDSVVVIENYKNGRLYATGTGFVYKTDDNYGYIITNEHVVDGATSVKVVFTNNESIDVKIIGSDSYSDIAVLSVDKSKVLTVAKTNSSANSLVGDTVFAVGAPIDASTYSWTVTRGIVSGKNREVKVSSGNSYYIMNVLQTDAAINSGNSGGPLCNSNGEVIGITNMKLASSEVEGMGFAIPIETAIEYADKFANGETVSRPYLGISMRDITSLSSTSNAIYIENVEQGSPAETSGLISGDKITKINGTEISDSSHFKYELYKYKVGDTITLTIERKDEVKDINITLGTSK